jgi:hypothetical protein
MTEGEPGKKPKRRRLQEGDIVYSPYEAPKGAPKGFMWVEHERHVEKNYPFRWKLVKVPEPPEKSTPPVSVTPEQVEESRKNYFPNIEDSLPTGDRD